MLDEPLEVENTSRSESADRDSAFPFYVVGVGASAGGLEALQEFFGCVERTAGIAYVVVQHLSPDFKSMMAELLGRHTPLSVREAVDGDIPAPDHVYLIPPRCVLTLEGGKLRLAERESAVPPQPINAFLESLAQAQGDLSAAVILSGTGTDGTHGVRLLKEAGGIVLAQEPNSAKFDSMPASIVNLGLADLVGEPGQLAERLCNFVKNPILGALGVASEDSEADSVAEILRLLRHRRRIDFTWYKQGTVVRRIQRRASLSSRDSMSDYLELLRVDAVEVDSLIRELLIGVTQFFRDEEAWRYIEDSVIPELVSSAAAHSTLRVWIAGCATGEEAYTMAMLLHEQLSRVDKPLGLRIFATDARSDSLEFARNGQYPAAACAAIPAELSMKYFEKDGENFLARRMLRDSITFAHHDLLIDPPFTQLNLVSCRNLLIYLKPEIQRKALARFRVALVEGAYLFLGTSESVGDAQAQFRSLNAAANVFVARGSPRLDRALGETGLRERRGEFSEQWRSGLTRSAEIIYEAVVKRYAPPGVAVDHQFELLQVFGDVSGIVTIPPGRLTVNLLRMVPQKLSVLLNSAGRKALKQNEELRISEVQIVRGEETRMVSIHVIPVDDLPNVARGLLIFFEDEGAREDSITSLGDVDEAIRQRVQELEHELTIARDNLHSAVQDLETTNEELQATNEELTASNEELQSTNEELQSVNEELYTVNSEYQQKIGELEELNDDLENVLSATEAGVLFLDESLAIRRFNDTARRLLPLRPEDIGRPLCEIAPHAQYPNMAADAAETLRTRQRRVVSVTSSDGAWWNVCMRLFQAHQAGPTGVIITMQEVSELKQAVSDLSRMTRAHEMAESIAAIGHVILDLSNELVHYSSGARQLLKLGETDVVPLVEALDMFGPSKAPAQEAIDMLKSGLDVPFTALRSIPLSDGSSVKVRLQVQTRVDPVTDARLLFAVFQVA